MKKKQSVVSQFSDSEEYYNDTPKKKERVIKCFDYYQRGEWKLIKTFIDKKTWVKVNNEFSADYSHYSSTSNLDWNISKSTLINRLPGVSFYALKREHSLIFNEYKKLHFHENDYFLETFILPEDEFKYQEIHKAHKKRTYISKINSGSQGFGIKLLKSPNDLVFDSYNPKLNDQVIQRYLSNPLLLGGKKHDLRIYVLIVSLDPFVVYVNDEGLVRFCIDDYEKPNKTNKIKENIHLTNYSISKHSDKYIKTNELYEVNDGTKRTLASYWKSLEENGIDVVDCQKKIDLLIQHSLKALKPYLLYSSTLQYGIGKKFGKCFHILGYDVILDTKGDPWLLEVNGNPSLNIEFDPEDYKPRVKQKKRAEISVVDQHVKSMVLDDAVRLCLTKKKGLVDRGRFNSYRQIMSPEIETSIFGDEPYTYEKLLQLFFSLAGCRFNGHHSMSRFGKLFPYFKGFGNYEVQKVDLDISFKKSLNNYSTMDFFAFTEAVWHLIQLSMGFDSELTKLQLLTEFLNRINL